MKKLDLTKALKSYESGWVIIDEVKRKVIAHAKDFNEISKLAQRKDINSSNTFIMPASKNYFGFIT